MECHDLIAKMKIGFELSQLISDQINKVLAFEIQLSALMGSYRAIRDMVSHTQSLPISALATKTYITSNCCNL
jgi:hypothetical protein